MHTALMHYIPFDIMLHDCSLGEYTRWVCAGSGKRTLNYYAALKELILPIPISAPHLTESGGGFVGIAFLQQHPAPSAAGLLLYVDNQGPGAVEEGGLHGVVGGRPGGGLCQQGWWLWRVGRPSGC